MIVSKSSSCFCVIEIVSPLRRQTLQYYKNHSTSHRDPLLRPSDSFITETLAALTTMANRELPIEEKAKRLHPNDHHYRLFRIFEEEAGHKLAAMFLDMLEKLLQFMELSPDHPRDQYAIRTLLGFACGEAPVPWTSTKFSPDAIAESLASSVKSGRVMLIATKQPILPRDVIARGYDSKYIGYNDIIAPILETLNDYATSWQSDVQFAPYTCLIGPTMIGKSRLLMEIAEEVCVVSICLRNEGSTGEPKRSLLADEVLLKASADYKDYYIRLITAILLVTVRFFESHPEEPKEKYQKWNKHQATTQFHTDVMKALNSCLFNAVTAVKQLGLAVDAMKRNASLAVPGLKVLLAIDEASAMLVEPANVEIHLFRLFRRAIREIPDHSGVFAIVVDTTSRVSNFCPVNREDRSSRAIGSRAKAPIKLFAPIYMIRTFDRKAHPQPNNWDELFLPNRLCSYGVPFFSIYLEDLMEDRAITPDTAIPPMVNFALQKLLCSEDITESLKLTEIQALAPVPVTKFLETLTGLPANDLPLGSIAKDPKRKLLEEGMMFWNHFMYCSSTPTSGSLMEGMERGMAMQCYPEQRAFDQILPIYLKHESRATLDEANLTFCGVQVKNRKDDRQLPEFQEKMTPESAGIKTNDCNPYLALYFSLQHKGPKDNPKVYQLPPFGTPDDRQASLVFYGIQAFDFLSPQLKHALEELINVRTDITSRHKEDPLGQGYAKDFMLLRD
ncbi:hypothetical protein PtA15_3A758 [Puccinia triticina]|uniref:Uncharacterized protein n=1 Tax=Puccinia triticina TaxID=208348 RepID=A0ABY7CEN7_9BASI|nr:uncharacterized protein PtA15_3A758 [Puccinia triticina]WAQ83388.1 hypothetical protein PtA15_3A758 [Puccinia triticina]